MPGAVIRLLEKIRPCGALSKDHFKESFVVVQFFTTSSKDRPHCKLNPGMLSNAKNSCFLAIVQRESTLAPPNCFITKYFCVHFLGRFYGKLCMQICRVLNY